MEAMARLDTLATQDFQVLVDILGLDYLALAVILVQVVTLVIQESLATLGILDQVDLVDIQVRLDILATLDIQV